jgi:hypothetical protein
MPRASQTLSRTTERKVPVFKKLTGKRRTRKIGADSGDPNLHSQPRLPGSVVGERSMRHIHSTHKITADTVPR